MSIPTALLVTIALCLLWSNSCLTETLDMDDISKRCEAQATWGPWRCPGEEKVCTQESAIRYKCIGGNCTLESPCATIAIFQQKKSCAVAMALGECVPWWGSWSPWSRCTATCGASERNRYRPCIGAWSLGVGKPDLVAHIQSSCISIARAAESGESADCPLRRLCTNVNGGWGAWGAFSPCSVSCGIGVRVRKRACNRPRPQGNGMACQGISKHQIYCRGSLPCPQQGNWCPWLKSVQQCSHPCGVTGMGLRLRYCACPKPSFGGSACEISPEAEQQADYESTKPNSSIPTPSAPAIEMIRTGQGKWDACNRHPCPYLTYLQPHEEEIVESDLNLQQPEDAWLWSGGYPAKTFEAVVLRCPASRESRVKIFDQPGRFPRSRAFWTKSILPSSHVPHDTVGDAMENSENILIQGDKLTIRSLVTPDTGVYRYGYEYEPGYFETICFFIVYLEEAVWEVEQGEQFDLKCSAIGMAPVLQRLNTIPWESYWEVFLDIAPNKPTTWWLTELSQSKPDLETEGNITTSGLSLWDVEYRRIYSAHPKISGRYKCVLRGIYNESERLFITEAFRLIVNDPPSLWTLVKNWMEENKTHLCVLFLVTAMASCMFAVYLWLRARRVARLQAHTKEESRKRKLINLADVDAKAN